MNQHGSGGHQGAGIQAELLRWGSRWQPPGEDDHLLALDDTDNLDSPGTGFRARELALHVAREELGRPVAITRHQLLVDPGIPYTSHNSSACVVLAGVTDPQAVFALACQYLSEAAAEGSDVGVVLTRRNRVDGRLRQWGLDAKSRVLRLDDARGLAREQAVRQGLRHAELSGTGGGLIGSLAAVGLHAAGDDGRFLWLRGIRELAGQTLSVAEAEAQVGVSVQVWPGLAAPGAPWRAPAQDEMLHLGDWPRAIYQGHRPVLLVEDMHDPTLGARWRCVSRDVVKQLSS